MTSPIEQRSEPRPEQSADHLREQRLGTVTLHPSGPVVAGTVGEWTLVYTVGRYGIDEGGTIKIARRFAGDWERPQFGNPSAPAYTTVRTSGEAKIHVRYDPKAHVRPWMKCIVIDVYDGCLAPGDTVTVTLGDRSGGSPGIRAQSFVESAHEIRVLVDPTNACLVERLPSSPVFSIVAGEPTSVVVITPTEVVVGEPAEIFLKGEDRWGNPTPAPSDVTLAWEGQGSPGPTPKPVEIEGRTLRPVAAGSGRVVATWKGERYPGNPTTVYAQAPARRRYWADLHAQSDATVGTGTEVEYFQFGRDWAHLDVMSHQGNDFQMTDEDWRRLNEVVAEFHEDGRFVVFPGYEWSANTTAGGDRNVIYLEEGLPIMRSSHWQIPEVPEDERTPAHPANVLFERLREHVPLDKVVVAAHCGGRYADIRRYFDEQIGPLVEVASCWGVFEWLLWDAFDKGYRVGVMCNSDGHKGRPGAEGPGAGQFGIYGGLTCILAESLTRPAVFVALQQRRCYGTTGPRIDLGFTVDGHPMGSSIVAGNTEGAGGAAEGTVQVRANARGTAPVESLLLYRGRELIHAEQPAAFDDVAGSRRVRMQWGGARIRGRGRRATWDGQIIVSGARIERAETFAFDSPVDGIVEQREHEIEIRSRTTGDIDGIDLWLDHGGPIGLKMLSQFAMVILDVDELGRPVREELGGLDLHVRVGRYPAQPRDLSLALETRVEASGGQPLWIKVVQVDGHMAWSSPIYVD